jgi:hypothetical protein
MRNVDLEYADQSRRHIPELTARRLQLLKHARCSCGEQAHSLIGDRFFCGSCAAVERTMRRGRHLIEMRRGF